MVQKFSNFVQRNKTLLRILISFILLFSIVLSILSYLIYTEYSESSVKDLYSVSLDMLNQNHSAADAQLLSVYNFFGRLYMQDNLIFNALYADNFKEFEMRDIHKKLNDVVQTNPIVESVYIFNRNADMVFSSKTSGQSVKGFYDRDISRFLSQPDAYGKILFLPRKVKYSIYDKEEEMNLISVIFGEAEPGEEMDSALIVNIDQVRLSKMFSTLPNEEMSQKIIINREGNIIVHNDGSLFGKNVAGEEFFRRIKSAPANEGYFTLEGKGEKSFVSFYKSGEAIGWYFVSIVKYENLVSKIKNTRNIIFQLTGLFLLIALLMSLFSIFRMYKPLHKLRNQIRSKGVNLKEEALSEFEYINEAFNYLNDNMLDMKVAMNNYKLAKKNQFLEKIIRGEMISMGEIQEELSRLELIMESRYYLACIIRIDSFNDFMSRYSNGDIALYRFAISNIASEILQKQFSVEVADGARDYISIVIKMENLEQMEMLKQSFAEIQQVVAKYLEISITVGMGSIAEKITDIHGSHFHAIAASNGRLTHGRGTIINYNEIIEREVVYVYPAELEKKLISSMSMENIEDTADCMEQFIEQISRYGYDEIMLSMMQLMLTLQKASTEYFGIERKQLGDEYQNSISHILECDTLEEIKNWILEMCTNIIVILQQRKENKRDKTLEKVIKFIEENYKNPDLTVETIADIAEFSPNHLRLVFKKMSGKSLSKYINEIRMVNAQKLLKETDYPANKIAQMVGLVNVSYFYTNFKKFTGRRPEHYREEPDKNN